MAKNNSEAKIKFTAETGSFNSAINKAESELKVLRAELKLNETQMKNAGESAEGLENSQKLLTAQLEQAQSKTEALRGKLDKAIEIYGEGSDVVANYKRAVANARIEEENISRKIATVTEKLGQQERAAEGSANANEKLTDKISRQERELSDLKSEYVEAVVKFGSASKEAQGLAREIDDLSGELKANKTSMATAEKEADELDKSFDDVEKTSGKLGDTLSKIGGTVVKGVAAGFATMVAAAGTAITAFLGSAEATREYREDIGKLQTAFQSSGKTTEQATETYKSFFSVLGEEDRSVEAVNHLAQLTNSQKELDQWTNICAGVWGTFGDSLPIEGLTEASNETAKTGKVTGVLADALNWVGLSEDEFNAKLEACTSEQERATLITETLNTAYDGAAQKYKELNGDIMDAQRAQSEFTDAMAGIGAAAEPVMTNIKLLGASILNDLSPSVSLIGEGLTGAMNGVEGSSEKLAAGVSGVLTTVSENLVNIINQVSEMLPSLIQTLLPNLISGLVSLIGSIAATLPSLLDSIFAVIPELINGIVSAFGEIVSYLPDLIQSICTALPTLIPALITGITTMIVTLCESFDDIIQPLIDSLPDIIISIVEAIVNNLPALIDGIITLVMGIVEAIPQIIQGIVDALPTIIELLITSLLSNLPKIIGGLIQVVWGIVSSLPQIFGSLIEGIGNIFVGIWEAIKNVFAKLGTWFKDKFGEGLKAIKDVFGKIGEWFGEKWQAIKDVFSNIGGWFKEKFSNAKENATAAWSNAKEKFTDIKDKVQGAFSNVGSWFKDKFSNAKENSVNVWSNIKEKFNGIKDKITSAFSNIKEKLSAPFEKARDAIKGVVDKIKSFFSGLKLDLPKIKLPHFKIEGKLSLDPPSVPKLKIDWYKDGGIMTRPTIFGVNGNSFMAGGEAGPEAILPISKLEDYIVGAIEKTVNVVNFESLAAAIEDLANRPMQMNINGREFAYATASDTDSVGGMRNSLVSRGLIVD